MLRYSLFRFGVAWSWEKTPTQAEEAGDANHSYLFVPTLIYQLEGVNCIARARYLRDSTCNEGVSSLGVRTI